MSNLKTIIGTLTAIVLAAAPTAAATDASEILGASQYFFAPPQKENGDPPKGNSTDGDRCSNYGQQVIIGNYHCDASNYQYCDQGTGAGAGAGAAGVGPGASGDAAAQATAGTSCNQDNRAAPANIDSGSRE